MNGLNLGAGQLPAAAQPQTTEMLGVIARQVHEGSQQIASLLADRSLLLVAAHIYADDPGESPQTASRKAFDLLDAFVAEGKAWQERHAEESAA